MTPSEENYIKVIYYLSLNSSNEITTNSIADKIDAKASSVTDMLKKLADKELLHYQKYQGVSLTEKGFVKAKSIVRKHRLWEVFLVDKLQFSWDEVHEIAEELEHIQSEKLIEKLDAFLEYPSEDPHGDPIPDKNGNVVKTEKHPLSELEINEKGICVGVKDSSSPFLQYLNKQKIALGSEICVLEKEPFDNSTIIQINEVKILISNKVASNLLVKKV
jgi:DtxR family transcriptional regulator, Mn-dependent transcriptional regulator